MRADQPVPSFGPSAYAELHCLSNFSFLRGASHPEELVARAAELGYAALAITDRNSLAGIVRAHRAAKEHGLHLIVGAEITPLDGPAVVLLAATRAAYGRLCRLITRGRRRCRKGECELRLADIAEVCSGSGLIAIVLGSCPSTPLPLKEGLGVGPTPPRADLSTPLWSPLRGGTVKPHPHTDSPRSPLPVPCSPSHPLNSSTPQSLDPFATYRAIFGPDHTFLACELSHAGADDAHVRRLAALSQSTGIPLVAANAVHYHIPERRYLQDVLTCIRHKCSLHDAGTRLAANAERHLRPRNEIAQRYAACPDAVARTVAIARRCTFSLDELKYEYPHEVVPAGRTATEYLAELTWAGAAERYPTGVPERVRGQLARELELIATLRYEHYFLTVWDLVRFARTRGILCQGRGSAANSAVCYCLGITAVDPARIDVLFERFISQERNEPPDIDVDFEHERREEVFQYIYDKYGRERAAITAEVITYRPRSAVRDVGKALGLSLDRVDTLAKALDWWNDEAVPDEALRVAGLEPGERTVQMLVRLVRQLLRFPRHLAQHVGGFVITETPLCEIVPLENGAMPGRTFIEWDKDDIDALGILKVDGLALGMLTAISRCFGLLRVYHEKGVRDLGSEGLRCGATPHAEPGACGALRSEGYGSAPQITARLGPLRAPIRTPHASAGPCGPALARRVLLAGLRKESGDACQAGVPGPDGLAEGHSTLRGGLRSHKVDAGGGAVRSGGADGASGGFDSEQHRRRPCAGYPQGLPARPDHRPRFAGGVGDAIGHRRRTQVHEQYGGRSEPDGRGVRDVPGTDLPPAQQVAPTRMGQSITPRQAGATDDQPQSLNPSIPQSLADVPPEDPAVYDLICAADTVGVFQIESRAQMSMLPRLKPRCFYDLVIEVAIVRPGPIQGGMIHPFLRRRDGVEAVTYPSEAVRAVLEKTLGVPLFQEQVMRLAVVAAGFTPGEADQLRRSMAAWRRGGDIGQFQLRLMQGLLANGYSREFAEQIYLQIRGFGEYGFPESHAASFALLVYASAWLKRYHPAAFCAALLNSQPMGFYAPAQLVRDAIRHGVRVLPVDINASDYDCTLECDPGARAPAAPPALRLGFRLVRGLSRAKVGGVLAARADGSIRSIERLARRPDVTRQTLVRLAAADAFRSLGLDRRRALWRILALDDARQPLLADIEPPAEPVNLPEPTPDETVVQDYDALGLSLTAHPIGLVRDELRRRGVKTAEELAGARHRQRIAVAGLVTHRQRPGTAKGMVFMTLEDETGHANLIIRPEVWERDKCIGRSKIALIGEGHVERQGAVVHVQVRRLRDLSAHISPVTARSRDFH